jgi:hypothetical protein
VYFDLVVLSKYESVMTGFSIPKSPPYGMDEHLGFWDHFYLDYQVFILKLLRIYLSMFNGQLYHNAIFIFAGMVVQHGDQ